MEQYWVEGLYVSKRGVKKAKRSGKIAQADLEPFARSFWATSPREALQMANEALQGGQWVKSPKVSKTSEEQRMRAMGAPEFKI